MALPKARAIKVELNLVVGWGEAAPADPDAPTSTSQVQEVDLDIHPPGATPSILNYPIERTARCWLARLVELQRLLHHLHKREGYDVRKLAGWTSNLPLGQVIIDMIGTTQYAGFALPTLSPREWFALCRIALPDDMGGVEVPKLFPNGRMPFPMPRMTREKVRLHLCGDSGLATRGRNDSSPVPASASGPRPTFIPPAAFAPR